MVVGGPEAYEWLVPKLSLGTQIVPQALLGDSG
jgi:hypothetical protein